MSSVSNHIPEVVQPLLDGTRYPRIKDPLGLAATREENQSLSLFSSELEAVLTYEKRSRSEGYSILTITFQNQNTTSIKETFTKQDPRGRTFMEGTTKYHGWCYKISTATNPALGVVIFSQEALNNHVFKWLKIILPKFA